MRFFSTISTILIISLLILSLVSCSHVDFDVNYLTNTGVKVEREDITLIKSQEELKEYRNSSRFSEAEENIIEKIDSYSSNFFNEKMLIVINLQEITGSSEITVKGIDFTDSEAVVKLRRRTPHIADDSIKIWSIFIELDIREIKSVKYTFS